MNPEFVSEPIKPMEGTTDTTTMSIGEPGLPRCFIWRDTEYTVERILEKWKETGPCSSGGDEMYVRKHWFRIRTISGEEMVLYFERQARSKETRKVRWWLFTVSR